MKTRNKYKKTRTETVYIHMEMVPHFCVDFFVKKHTCMLWLHMNWRMLYNRIIVFGLSAFLEGFGVMQYSILISILMLGMFWGWHKMKWKCFTIVYMNKIMMLMPSCGQQFYKVSLKLVENASKCPWILSVMRTKVWAMYENRIKKMFSTKNTSLDCFYV